MDKNALERSERLVPLDQVDKCWFLGIAWCSIRSLYSNSSQTAGASRDLRHWLHFLLNTCKQMELNDEDVTSVLNKLNTKVTHGRPLTPDEDELEHIQPILEAALRARNPYYYDIFIAARNASSMKNAFEPDEMTTERSVFREFLRAFQYLRPILSQETFDLISGAMNRWDAEWLKHKRKHKTPDEIKRFAAQLREGDLSGLEVKTHGLLVESIRANDLLHFADRIWVEFLSGLGILVLGTLLVLFALAVFRFLSPWLLNGLTFPIAIEQTDKLIGVLNSSLALLGALGVSIAGIGRFFWQAGKETRAAYQLHLAQERLVHPARPLVL